MKSIRANPTNGAPEGDERIRTAVGAPRADAVYGRRGKCRYCGYSVRLRVNGEPGLHYVYVGHQRLVCLGSPWFPHGEDVAVWLAARGAVS